MSQEANVFQLEIPRRANHCVQGNEGLLPGMEYYSILIPENDKGYQRHDFCLSCWETSGKEKYSHAVKTAWRAKVASKQEVEDLSTKTRDEKAFHLLKEALQKGDEENWAEIFILALYLARRRILYLRQEIAQPDDSTVCIYEVAATEEMWTIKRRSLTSVDIEQIQEKIAQKLRQ